MEIHLYHCNNSAEWLTVMDYTAQGMFVFAAELSPHAQQNENSRHPQLELIWGGRGDDRCRKTSKNTVGQR